MSETPKVKVKVSEYKWSCTCGASNSTDYPWIVQCSSCGKVYHGEIEKGN